MGFFEFPNSRTYDSDLGWLISAMKKLIDEMDSFVKFNKIKFADPIIWDITKNYEATTVVLDSQGNGYISQKAVPAGVALTNTDYWTPIFSFGALLDVLREQIATINEGDSPTATQNRIIGDLIWWNDILYRVVVNIPIGSAYIEGSNIEHVTIEGLLNDLELKLNTRIDIEKDDILVKLSRIHNVDRFCFHWSPVAPSGFYPQGLCFIDDNTYVAFYDNENGTANTGYIQKVRISDGLVLNSNNLSDCYHGNALAYIPDTNEIYSVNYYSSLHTGISNLITVFDADTLTKKRTIAISGLNSISYICYHKGVLYVANKDTYASLYSVDLDGNNLQSICTFPIAYMWEFTIDNNENIWGLNSFNGLFVFDFNGNAIASYELSALSADNSSLLSEIESINVLSDGTVILADQGYIRTTGSTGYTRRHILMSLGKDISGKSVPIGIRYRTDMTYYCDPDYRPFQNGTASYPFDSIDYTARVCSAYTTDRVVIDGGNKIYNQWLAIKQSTYIILNNMTIQGLVVLNSSVASQGNLTIKNGAYAELGRYVGNTSLKYNVYINQHGRVEFANTSIFIDGNNLADSCGIWQGPDCEALCVGGRIINVSTPIIGQWAQITNFGNYSIAQGTDDPYNTYHKAQPGNVFYPRCGGSYGMAKKTFASGTFLNNVGVIKFNAASFVGSMVSVALYNRTYIFDISVSNRIYAVSAIGTNIIGVSAEIKITDEPDGFTIEFINLTEITWNVTAGTATVSQTPGSDMPINAISVW